jgi:hypothetical protein
MSTGHIRPKIRKAGKPKAAVRQEAPKTDDQALEDVRLKMEQWMGLGESKPRQKSSSEVMFPATIEIPSTAVEVQHKNTTINDNQKETAANTAGKATQEKPEPKSILKKPKYSKPIDIQAEHAEPELTATKKSIFKQDCIQERIPSGGSQRKPFPLNPQQAASAAMAVEGYQPMMDHNVRIKSAKQKTEESEDEKDEEEEDDDDDNKEPMIFNSLVDLMEAVGDLPDQDLTKDPQVVEAELAFSCMTPEDYNAGLILQGMEEREKAEEAKQDHTPEWKKPISQTCQLDVDDAVNNPVSDDEATMEEDKSQGEDDGGGGGLFGLMGGDDSDSEEEEAAVFTPRTFRILWECLSPLITHDSCVFLKRLKKEQETGTSSSYLITTTLHTDLETNRASGFLSMLRLYMGRALKELDQPTEMRRTAEQRLHGLLYTFNFTRPAAKLETKHWKALTCIFLEMVLFLDQPTSKDGAIPPIPPSAVEADMSPDEYRYLVKNTIKIFDIPDPVI